MASQKRTASRIDDDDECRAKDVPAKRHFTDVASDEKRNLEQVDDLYTETATGNANEILISLKSLKIFIVQAGIGKSRTDLFKKQIKNLGVTFFDTFDKEKVTHVVVDEKMDVERLVRILKLDSLAELNKVKVVKSLWLSACIKNKEYMNTKEFELTPPDATKTCPKSDMKPDPKTPETQGETTVNGNTENKWITQPSMKPMQKQHPHRDTIQKAESDESDYVPSGDEDFYDDLGIGDAAAVSPSVTNYKDLPRGNWICAQSSRTPHLQPNYNVHITEKLEEMANTYQSMNERWRALGYQKAIIALKKHPKLITSFEEAKSLHGIGERLAEKIWEIAESGELRKLNELTSREENQAMALFTNIWGAGAQTARAWVMQGFRTLDDLREKTTLTKNQQIGLKYYDELLDRMSREEAAQIEATVRNIALSIQPGLIALACGSYRRGKATCGDVDVLITHPDGKSHANVYHPLLHRLHETGFLTDDLVSMENDGPHSKYLGVCRLPGDNSKHRRLDIIVVPYNEYACALMYFTGSAHFNRSLRHLCGRMNMSLNEHALSAGVVRSKGMKLNSGTALHTPTEESIFEHLGIPYRPPEERDH